MNNQDCKARPKVIDINSDEPVFYSYSIKVNKSSRSCSNIHNPCAKLCVPDIIKHINVKVFNLMSRINETRQIIWHETCKCVCRLTSIDRYGTMTSADANVKKIWLIKWCVIKDIFGILAAVLVNVINHVE